MNVKLLVDAIMRQTTVLIAQISTAAGVRAPLAHLADQVFLSLAKEIEAQGVGKKVVADMFGMALRSYQRKTQRISATPTVQGKTLFEAVLGFVEANDGATRARVLERFARDGDRETIGVLTDLVHSGLLYCTGAGNDTLYGVTSDAERQRLTRRIEQTALADMAWGQLYRSREASVTDLAVQLGTDDASLEPVIATLVADGRVSERISDGVRLLSSSTYQVPVGSEHGWESAVADHFQAVATTIASKIAMRGSPADNDGLLGGTTLRFELYDDHPQRREVLNLLSRLRGELMDLWTRVADHNDAHPADESARFDVCFYFGQTLDDPERTLSQPANERASS